MDSSSPSHPQINIPQGGYDVFISFRGKDTRNNFTSHLHAALRQKQILSFIDSKHLRAGDEISTSLFNAIEGSKLYLVIFSPNYASSKWCLLELEKILECKETKGKTIMPVFYKIDPSHLRYQNESFIDTFRKHEGRETMDRVQRWRDVLKEAANLSGWASHEAWTESELVKNIVNCILKKLNKLSSTYSGGLVGIDPHIKELKSLLCMDSPSQDVCSVGIWGMGGIGKTTIARALFDSIHSLFSGCFFANVSEEIARHGVDAFKIKLLQEILDEKDVFRSTQSLSWTFIRERLMRKKVLIVLDDVDISVSIQLPELETHHNLFGSGSRVVMTSRDKQVLKNLSVDKVFMVKGLNGYEALQLFRLNAFKDNRPAIDYMELVEMVVRYAKGNPLALKIFGCALLDRDKEYWECALNKIEKFQKKDIEAILRVSYDGLSTNEQNIFLDIACFLEGENKDCVIKVLDNFRDAVYCSVIKLIDKCLVTITDSNKLEMHHLLQEMGQAIVCEESTNPGNRSRLLDPEEICDVLMNKKGTEAIQSINLDLSKVTEMHLSADAFVRMKNLRMLRIAGWNSKAHTLNHDIQFWSNKMSYIRWRAFQYFGWGPQVQISDHNFRLFPKELRYLSWNAFPLKFFPSNFCAENLVSLNLQFGKFKRLWQGAQNVVNLKWVDLSWCEDLTEIPDLSNAKNIETMDLLKCRSLVTLHSSVQHLTNLQSLNLFACQSLRNLPCSEHRKRFDASNISCMTKFPEVQSSIHSLTALRSLVMSYNQNLSCLPTNMWEWKSLHYLDLSNCPKLEAFPEILHPMKCLSTLNLSACYNLKALPNNLSNLTSLDTLKINSCELIRFIPMLPQSLRCLEADYCESLETLSIGSNCDIDEMSFRNCYKLDEKSRRQIISHARIQLGNARDITIILPGTEIPQCFPHRSVGSSITVPTRFNPIHIERITFSIVYQTVSIPWGTSWLRFNFKCYDEFNTGAIFEEKMRTKFFLLDSVKSDHLLLGKLPNCFFPRHYHKFLTLKESLSKCSEASIEFRPKPSLNYLVNQCGVDFHYGKEYSNSSSEEYSNGNSEEYSHSGDENRKKSMGEDAHSKGGCDDYCLTGVKLGTRTRATDEEEEDKPPQTKKIKPQ